MDESVGLEMWAGAYGVRQKEGVKDAHLVFLTFPHLHLPSQVIAQMRQQQGDHVGAIAVLTQGISVNDDDAMVRSVDCVEAG